MAKKITKKTKKQKESNMEVTLLKSAKDQDLDDGIIIDDEIDEIVDVADNKQKADLEIALSLFDGEKEIIIDRDQEDLDVTEFQKTGDLELLEKVYKNRIPTLKSWATKKFYPGLTTSVEDLFEDLSVVFVKAAEKYVKNRGSFNTCLFTFLDHRIKNLHNSKYAKKRISENYDGPLNGMILSLDFSYNDSDGGEITLKDIIPSKVDAEESLDFRDIISFMSKGNPLLIEFFKKICAGNSLASLLKEYKTKKGMIDLSSHKQELKKLASRRNKKLASEIIKSRNILKGDFKLLEYTISGNNKNHLNYTVEMRKTKETDLIIKLIRDMKKHKQYYISKIRGD